MEPAGRTRRPRRRVEDRGPEREDPWQRLGLDADEGQTNWLAWGVAIGLSVLVLILGQVALHADRWVSEAVRAEEGVHEFTVETGWGLRDYTLQMDSDFDEGFHLHETIPLEDVAEREQVLGDGPYTDPDLAAWNDVGFAAFVLLWIAWFVLLASLGLLLAAPFVQKPLLRGGSTWGLLVGGSMVLAGTVGWLVAGPELANSPYWELAIDEWRAAGLTVTVQDRGLAWTWWLSLLTSLLALGAGAASSLQVTTGALGSLRPLRTLEQGSSPFTPVAAVGVVGLLLLVILAGGGGVAALASTVDTESGVIDADGDDPGDPPGSLTYYADWGARNWNLEHWDDEVVDDGEHVVIDRELASLVGHNLTGVRVLYRCQDDSGALAETWPLDQVDTIEITIQAPGATAYQTGTNTCNDQPNTVKEVTIGEVDAVPHDEPAADEGEAQRLLDEAATSEYEGQWIITVDLETSDQIIDGVPIADESATVYLEVLAYGFDGSVFVWFDA